MQSLDDLPTYLEIQNVQQRHSCSSNNDGANLKIETSWVSPPQSVGGLDHLGTQAPCVLIYGQLLPGITNVTDRARYYSLYPWLIWAFDQRYAKDDESKFIEYFRRGDCLFTLISERHSRRTDKDNERHGVAMVGRNQLTQALDRLERGEPLKLSEFTAQASPLRYCHRPPYRLHSMTAV